MKLAKLFVCLGTAAMAWASASDRFNITLGNPASVAGTELPRGEYRVEINGDTATIQGNKLSVKSPIKMEEVAQKFTATMVRYRMEDGKYKLSEIMLGGSKSKVVFSN